MRKATVIAGQTLEDIALAYYGHVSATGPMAIANGLSLTDEPIAGQAIVLPEWSAASESTKGILQQDAERNYLVAVMEGQSLEDIALQEYGTPLAVMLILAHNAGLTPGAALPAGTWLRIVGPPVEPAMYAYYRSNGLQPASGDGESATGPGDYNMDYNEDYY